MRENERERERERESEVCTKRTFPQPNTDRERGGSKLAYRATPETLLAGPGAGLVEMNNGCLPIPPSRATETCLGVIAAFSSTGSPVRGAVGTRAAVITRAAGAGSTGLCVLGGAADAGCTTGRLVSSWA